MTWSVKRRVADVGAQELVEAGRVEVAICCARSRKSPGALRSSPVIAGRLAVRRDRRRQPWPTLRPCVGRARWRQQPSRAGSQAPDRQSERTVAIASSIGMSSSGVQAPRPSESATADRERRVGVRGTGDAWRERKWGMDDAGHVASRCDLVSPRPSGARFSWRRRSGVVPVVERDELVCDPAADEPVVCSRRASCARSSSSRMTGAIHASTPPARVTMTFADLLTSSRLRGPHARLAARPPSCADAIRVAPRAATSVSAWLSTLGRSSGR